MSKFEDVLENIVKRQAPGGFFYNRIFVVSAYNNVTNWLLEHKKSGEPGVYDLFVTNTKFLKKGIDMGVANPSAQGHAMTRTAIIAVRAKSRDSPTRLAAMTSRPRKMAGKRMSPGWLR